MNWNSSLHFPNFKRWFDVKVTLKSDGNLTLGTHRFDFPSCMSCTGRKNFAAEIKNVSVICNFSLIIKTFDQTIF